ncbi:hypothetical protein AB0G15_05375 [Streptosporangium sp. NPDC023825]|uniref:T4 family baseplate hub assembly chaperone n=1 Tax=Streptosporangium sp. NPDC023825 TaxID=3154909 RepID=UPI0034138757
MFPENSPSSIQFFDATDPGVAAKMESVLEQESPRPEIGELHDDQVSLPGGLVRHGTLVRTARVRELTGADEEELSRATTTEGMITTLLHRGVVSLGGAELSTPAVLDSMLVGDRDALILGIRRACFGPTIDIEKYTCPGCSGEFALSIDLDDIPTVTSTTPGEMTIVVDLNRGRKARVKLVTGYDQLALLEASRTKKLTGAQQDTLLLSRTVLAIINADGTETEIGTNPDQARSLSIADRRAIMRDLQSRRPGPRMDEVKITCPDCQLEQEVSITVDLLFRG